MEATEEGVRIEAPRPEGQLSVSRGEAAESEGRSRAELDGVAERLKGLLPPMEGLLLGQMLQIFNAMGAFILVSNSLSLPFLFPAASCSTCISLHSWGIIWPILRAWLPRCKKRWTS